MSDIHARQYSYSVRITMFVCFFVFFCLFVFFFFVFFFVFVFFVFVFYFFFVFCCFLIFSRKNISWIFGFEHPRLHKKG